jgi:Outer membrane lipoprotein carrier protein LolA-like
MLAWLLPTIAVAAGIPADRPVAQAIVRTVPRADTPPGSEALLHDVMQRLAAIPERHCTFHEEKRLAVLDHPLLSDGRLLYLRPSRFEKITTAPEPESLVVDGDRLALTRPGEAPQNLSLSERPEIAALVNAVRGLLSGNLALLQQDYHVQGSGSLGNWRLVLLPADARVAELIRAVVVDGASTHIARFTTDAANGDISVMTIGDTC